MGFIKKTWKNRVVQYPLRRLLTIVRDFDTTGTGVMDIQREDGEITEEGDTFSAANMNDLESRIETGIEERLEKVTTMPTASADLLDVSVIYVGATDSNYTEGNTYKCKLVNGNYTWVHIGAAEITVDSAMSTTSENPVQNKVVNSAISDVDTKATNAASTASSAASTASSAASTASTASTNATNALGMIKDSSDAYSSTKAYKVGDHCIQNSIVYRCKTACSAASWNTNKNCFEATTLIKTASELSKLANIPLNTEEAIGTFNGKTLYRQSISGSGSWTATTDLDTTLKSSYFDTIVKFETSMKLNSGTWVNFTDAYTGSTRYLAMIVISSTSLLLQIANYTVTKYVVTIEYTKA